MGAVFAFFSGFYYWYRRMFNYNINEKLASIHFWLTFLGVNLTFFPMHFLGLAGMPRRIPDYPDAYAAFNLIASWGSLISLIGVFVFIFAIKRSVFKKSYVVFFSKRLSSYLTSSFFLFLERRPRLRRKLYRIKTKIQTNPTIQQIYVKMQNMLCKVAEVVVRIYTRLKENTYKNLNTLCIKIFKQPFPEIHAQVLKMIAFSKAEIKQNLEERTKEKENFYAMFSEPFRGNYSNEVESKYKLKFSKKYYRKLKIFADIAAKRPLPKTRGLSEEEKRKLLLAELYAVDYNPFRD
jgi:hypothetical protein